MLMLGSSESGLSGEVAGKLNDLLTDSDEESELSNECLVEEGKLEEIMQELYKEITNPSSQPMVTLPSPSSSSSSSSSPHPPTFFSATSDVKSETCGAALSDSSSTLMAGIAFVGPLGKLPEKEVGGPAEGCDGEEEYGNDEWMTRVLGWGPLEIEDWS